VPLPAEAPAPINVSRQRYEPAHVYARPYPVSPAASVRRRLLREQHKRRSRRRPKRRV